MNQSLSTKAGTRAKRAAAESAVTMTAPKALILDLDASKAGVQSSSRKFFGASSDLFQKSIAAPTRDDIASIKLTLSSPSAKAGNDTLIYEDGRQHRLDFAEISSAKNQVIAGVSGVTFNFDDRTKTLEFTKTYGGVFTGAETKAVLKAISLRTSAGNKSKHVVDVAISDRDGNVGNAQAVLYVDTNRAPSITASLASSKQTSLRIRELGDILGEHDPTQLSQGESVRIIPPKSWSAKGFLEAIKGISVDWDGPSVEPHEGGLPTYRSFETFDKSPVAGEKFGLMFQGGSYVKSSKFSFDLSADGKQLMLTHRGEPLALENTNLYHVGGPYQSGREDSGTYNIKNIKLLYEIETHNVDSTPTVKAHYDGTRSLAGDVISLYEGNRLLASKVLTEKDIGKNHAPVTLSVPETLSPGEHHLNLKYTKASGDADSSNTVVARMEPDASIFDPQLWPFFRFAMENRHESTSLVKIPFYADYNYDVPYPIITNAGSFWAPGSHHWGPTISGSLMNNQSNGPYLVTAKIGEKVVSFGKGEGEYFEVFVPASSVAPGFYDNLSLSFTNMTPGIKDGQTKTFGGLKLGWYWASQALGDTRGGPSDDTIPLGATMGGAKTLITTGDGQDTLVLGPFGRGRDGDPKNWEQDSNRIYFEATVTDFVLGSDRVQTYHGLVLDLVNWEQQQQFVKEVSPIEDGKGTKLIVDLDGSGPGTQTYTLNLQNVAYNPNNTHTLFGV